MLGAHPSRERQQILLVPPARFPSTAFNALGLSRFCSEQPLCKSATNFGSTVTVLFGHVSTRSGYGMCQKTTQFAAGTVLRLFFWLTRFGTLILSIVKQDQFPVCGIRILLMEPHYLPLRISPPSYAQHIPIIIFLVLAMNAG